MEEKKENLKKAVRIKKEIRKEKIEEIKEKVAEKTEKVASKLEKERNSTPLTAPKKLKVLFTIVPRNKADFYLDILKGYEINMQMVLFGTGTLPPALADQLHTNPDKAVILSVVNADYVKPIMNAYEDKYFKLINGQGIAFTVSLSSVIGKAVYQFLANMEAEQ